MIDDATRQVLLGKLDAFDAMRARIAVNADPIRAAFKEAIREHEEAEGAIDQEQEEALEAVGVEIIGRCETCDRRLFTGDKAAHIEEGGYLCEAHAPTWSELLDSYRAHGADALDFPEDFDDLVEHAAAMVLAGHGDESVAVPV